MFKGHSFALQYAPFRLAIKPISEAEEHHIAPWNGLYCTVKWAISESGTCFSCLWYRVYERVVQTETASTTLYLTFLYISFGKIFCQNSVKKNCKYVPPVFLKKAGIRLENYWQEAWAKPRKGCSGRGMMIEPKSVIIPHTVLYILCIHTFSRLCAFHWHLFVRFFLT